MTLTIVINVILCLAVLVAAAGGLGWAIWTDRPQRELQRPGSPIRHEVRQHADGRQPHPSRARQLRL